MEEKSNIKLYVIIAILGILVIIFGGITIHSNIKNKKPEKQAPEVKKITKEEVIDYANGIAEYSGFAGLYKDGFKGNLIDASEEQKFAFAYTLSDEFERFEYNQIFKENYPDDEVDELNNKAAAGKMDPNIKLYPWYSNVFVKLINYKEKDNKFILTYKTLYAFINFEESPALYLQNIKGDTLYTGKNGNDTVLKKIAYDENFDPEELLTKYDKQLINIDFIFEEENNRLVLKSINY